MAQLEREALDDPAKYEEAERFRDSIYNFNAGNKKNVRCKVYQNSLEDEYRAMMEEHDSATGSSPRNAYNNEFTYLGRRQRIKYENLEHAKRIQSEIQREGRLRVDQVKLSSIERVALALDQQAAEHKDMDLRKFDTSKIQLSRQINK